MHGVEEGTTQAPLPGRIRGPAPPHSLAAAAAGKTFPSMGMVPLIRHVPLTPDGRDCLAMRFSRIFMLDQSLLFSARTREILRENV